MRLLAAMDERHNTPNGLTLKKLCERACEVFGQGMSLLSVMRNLRRIVLKLTNSGNK